LGLNKRDAVLLVREESFVLEFLPAGRQVCFFLIKQKVQEDKKNDFFIE
jgi:hypothetical protein